MDDIWPPLPGHVEVTIHAIARLHAEHASSASRVERMVDRITTALGRPRAGLTFLLGVVVWVAANGTMQLIGGRPADAAPFAWLQLMLSIFAVFMTIVILASQQRAQNLASRREKLMLQLAFLGDQKAAKTIALIEELRRDDPMIKNRTDAQAAAMTKTADPRTVLHAIEATTEDLVVTAKVEVEGETAKGK